MFLRLSRTPPFSWPGFGMLQDVVLVEVFAHNVDVECSVGVTLEVPRVCPQHIVAVNYALFQYDGPRHKHDKDCQEGWLSRRAYGKREAGAWWTSAWLSNLGGHAAWGGLAPAGQQDAPLD
jgi:hypothetical protein